MNKSTIRNAFVVTAVTLFVAMAFCAPALAEDGICCKVGGTSCVDAYSWCWTQDPCPPGYTCTHDHGKCARFSSCCEWPGGACTMVNHHCCNALGGTPSNCCILESTSLEDDGEAEGLAPDEGLSPDEGIETQASDQGRNLWPFGLAGMLILPAIPIIRRRRHR